MTDEIKVGDWAVSTMSGCHEAFRVVNILDGMLVDKWGGLHGSGCFKKYKGATSPLEAAEVGKDEFYRRVGLL